MASTTKERIRRSIAHQKCAVFVRQDFAKFGTPSRVTRAINELIVDGKLVRLGYGVYAKASRSQTTGLVVPVQTVDELYPEIYKKLDIDFEYSLWARLYNENKSTQIPMNIHVSTPGRRISRQIGFGQRKVEYEKYQPSTV